MLLPKEEEVHLFIFLTYLSNRRKVIPRNAIHSPPLDSNCYSDNIHKNGYSIKNTPRIRLKDLSVTIYKFEPFTCITTCFLGL